MSQLFNDILKIVDNKTIGYKAYFLLPDGRVGITASYSLKVLKSLVIPEAKQAGHKLLKIEVAE